MDAQPTPSDSVQETSESQANQAEPMEIEGEGDLKGKKEDKAPQRQQLSPLDLPELVEAIARQVDSVEELKTFRLVCKFWNYNSQKRWRNTAVVVLNEETIPVFLSAFNRNGNEEHDGPDPYYLRVQPYKRFRFSFNQKQLPWIYPLQEGQDGLETKQAVWSNILGPHASYLDLGTCRLRIGQRQIVPEFMNEFRNRTTYIHGITWILRSAQKLVELKMDPVCDPHAVPALRIEPVATSVLLWKLNIGNRHLPAEAFFQYAPVDDLTTFFRMVPKLKDLKVSNQHRCLPMLNGLINLSSTQNKIQLETFEASHIETAVLAEFAHRLHLYISNCKLIKTLRIPLIVQEFTRDDLFDNGPTMLAKVQDTLEQLYIHLVVDDEVQVGAYLRFSGCHFPKMETFRVTMQYLRPMREALTFRFENLRRMPQIKQFGFFGVPRNYVEPLPIREFVPASILLPHLTHFHFRGNFENRALLQMARSAENVEVLQLRFSAENGETLLNRTAYHLLQNLKLLMGSNLSEEAVQVIKAVRPYLQTVAHE